VGERREAIAPDRWNRTTSVGAKVDRHHAQGEDTIGIDTLMENETLGNDAISGMDAATVEVWRSVDPRHDPRDDPRRHPRHAGHHAPFSSSSSASFKLTSSSFLYARKR